MGTKDEKKLEKVLKQAYSKKDGPLRMRITDEEALDEYNKYINEAHLVTL